MSDLSKTNNSIYTNDELEVMEKTKKIRINVIDHMVKDGLPDKVGEIRVLNELLSAAEKNVQDSANNRLKFQDNQNKEAVIETVAEMFKKIHTQKANSYNPDKIVELEDEYIPIDIVHGETEITPGQLELELFTNKEG